MTIIVGITSSGMFVPPGSDWAIQPCVVIAADTRISYLTGPRDFGAKCDNIGQWAIVGYTGDTGIGTDIAAMLDDYASSVGTKDFDALVAKAESLLNDRGGELAAWCADLSLIVAAYDSVQGIPRLVSVTWENKAVVRNHPDIVVMGSGMPGLKEYAVQAAMSYRVGKDDPEIGATLSSETFSQFAIHLVFHSLEEAAARESANQTDDDVGGTVQACVSDAAGVRSFEPEFHDQLSVGGNRYTSEDTGID